MRAALFNGPRTITVGERPDPTIEKPSDAIVRVVLGCVCGSDLWYFRGDSPHDLGAIGHELIGVVEDVGANVRGVARGDLVIAPFTYCDGTLPELPRRCHLAVCQRRGLWQPRR
jgi:threonine dehydrogenase-like Zn-dependent dehydrogenase